MSTLQVGTAKAIPGEVSIGKLKIAELADCTEINLPVIIVQGEQEGPTLLLTSTVHGPEITGGEVIRQVCRKIIDPKKLRGTIIALPLCNPFAFWECTWTTPQDGMNLNRAFPGEPDKWLSQKIAYDLLHEAIVKSNYIIDFHAMCDPTLLHISVKKAKSEELWTKAKRLADVFGLPILLQAESMEHRAGTLMSAAAEHGVCGISVELKVWRRMDKESVDIGIRGTLNVMRELGMIDGAIEPQTGLPDVPTPLKWLEFFAQRGGIVHFLKQPGDALKKGEAFLEIITPVGDVVETIVSPEDTVVLGYPLFRNQAVGTGEMLAFLGAPIKG